MHMIAGMIIMNAMATFVFFDISLLCVSGCLLRANKIKNTIKHTIVIAKKGNTERNLHVGDACL